jgi:hypothetical protein
MTTGLAERPGHEYVWAKTVFLEKESTTNAQKSRRTIMLGGGWW